MEQYANYDSEASFMSFIYRVLENGLIVTGIKPVPCHPADGHGLQPSRGIVWSGTRANHQIPCLALALLKLSSVDTSASVA
jgi:hypothetical protein